jgi:hypothetical protein
MACSNTAVAAPVLSGAIGGVSLCLRARGPRQTGGKPT